MNSNIEITRICPECGGQIVEGIEIGKGARRAIKAGIAFFASPFLLPFADDFIDGAINAIGSNGLLCEDCGYKWELFDEIKSGISSLASKIDEDIVSNPRESTNFYYLVNTFDKIIDGIKVLDSEKVSEEDKETLLWYAYYRKAKFLFNKHESKLNVLLDDDEIPDQELEDVDKLNDSIWLTIDDEARYMSDIPARLQGDAELRAMALSIHLFYYKCYTIDVYNIFLGALSDDSENKSSIKSNIDVARNNMIKAWTPNEDGECIFMFTRDKEFENRKVIFIAKRESDLYGFWDRTDTINYVFTLDCIPPDIKFPLGPAVGNTLYVANPAKPDEYVPYNNNEYALFMDKIRELKRLLRALGATEITFTSEKGSSVEELTKTSWNASGEANFKVHKASGGVQSSHSRQATSSRDLKVDFIERLNPLSAPSLPDDLHWYYIDPEWKDLVEARLKHNQLHFEQSISTKQVSSLDEQSQLDVNAVYENLVLSINAKYHREREFHVKTSEETMWHITAEFKPLDEFDINGVAHRRESQGSLNPNEQDYLDAIKDLLADGEISNRERHMLERIRKSKGISEQRAAELEASLTPQLTEDEIEYLEMYREYAEQGNINDKVRRRLDRYAESLGLTNDRVKQLEALNR